MSLDRKQRPRPPPVLHPLVHPLPTPTILPTCSIWAFCEAILPGKRFSPLQLSQNVVAYTCSTEKGTVRRYPQILDEETA
jgi:hypothetical protein